MSDSDDENVFNKDGLYVVIDKRERQIIPHFEKLQSSAGISYFVEHMTIGDIAICYRSYILIIIERKTWTDLGASIKDGRKANIEKLKSLREKTECQIAYLMEGNPCPNSKKKFARIPAKNLQSHLDHLAFRDGVHMIFAKTCHDTANRVFELAKNYSTIAPSPLTEIDEIIDKETPESKETSESKEISKGGRKLLDKVQEQLQVKHVASDELILFKMWTSFPNITDKTANMFSIKYKLKDLILGTPTKKEITVMRYPSGVMIGPKRAANILRNAKLAKIHARVLSEIPSITKKTAEKILEVVSMEEILTLDEEEILEKISKVQKTEKVKVGQTSAKKIQKYIFM
jgi:ERCC4-type nuclease